MTEERQPILRTKSSLPNWLVKQAHEEPSFQPSLFSSTRRNIAELIESHKVQIGLLVLLLFDVAIVIAELILESTHQCVAIPGEFEKYRIEYPAHWMDYLSEVFHILSIAILCVFALELLLLLFALGFAFFRKLLYVLDIIVVSVSLVIDILLSDALSSLIILFRLWRLLRIVHGIYASIEEVSQEKELEREKHIEALRTRRGYLQQEILGLKSKYKKLKP
eukprot:TRINITY_DN6013_c0_g1_i1.p1 TRINITY_DN6013_c0_g1~~TRINITY_DN6013_c0_g1_i1.p1  ORF type:complete len:221 (-),score=27.64 TRINITY_DN6013_c0_g1_i1:75-737(-)